MRLAAKVTLTTGFITLSATLSVGLAVLFTTYDTGINQIENRLEQLVYDIEASNDDPLSSALLAVESQEISLTYFEADGSRTSLQEVPFTGVSDPVVTRSIDLGNDEKLSLAISTKILQDNAWSSALLSLLLAAFAAAIATLVSRWILTRDLSHINTLTKAANSISQGEEADLTGLGTSLEITELSKALEIMVGRLQSSKNEMQDFLSDASHELRTPLTVIRGYLELLLENPEIPKDKFENSVSRAHTEALRMQRLINNILTLAELGQLPSLEMSDVNLPDLIQARIDDLRTLSAQRLIEMASSKPKPVKGSAELLSQLFANIFGNITNHTPSNSKVRVGIQDAEDFVEIQVDDAGPGIKDLRSGEVLTEFRRFDSTRSRVSGGSGLGLSIMARIVELHHGKLELSKSDLGGLRVLVKLPKF